MNIYPDKKNTLLFYLGLVTGALMLLASFNASAVILEIVAMDEVLEASSIIVEPGGSKNSGKVTIGKCRICPMTLHFDEKSRFLHKGKTIKPKKAKRLSDKDGVVSYDAKSKLVTRITWN